MGSGDLNEVIEFRLNAAKKWAGSSESYLTSFELIYSEDSKKIYNALLSDVFVDLYKFLGDKYSGSIRNYFMSLPKEIAKIPLFGIEKGKLSLKESEKDEEGNYIQNYEFGKGKSLKIVIANSEKPVLAVGALDKRILVECIKYIGPDFYRTHEVRVKKSELIKLFTPNYRASKLCYDRMEERCLNLANYKYMIYDKESEKEVERINLVDRVSVKISRIYNLCAWLCLISKYY